MTPDREQALTLFREHNKTDSLYHHAMAVEAVMRYFARERGEDEEKWGIIGLIHDLDWEKWPQQHCERTREILMEKEWPEDWIRAILSHGWGIVTDVEPQSIMEKVLYTIDELTGLITATAIMRPSRSFFDLTVKSVMKKWKDKRFAAGVDRGVIDKGVAMLGMERVAVIEDCITAMRSAEEAVLGG